MRRQFNIYLPAMTANSREMFDMLISAGWTITQTPTVILEPLPRREII